MILLAITIAEVPEVALRKRVTVEALPLGLYRVRARYGFLEEADVTDMLAHCRTAGIRAEDDDTTYYLGRAASANGARAHDALAQAAVWPHGPQCQLRRRFLQDSARSRRGARRASGVLKAPDSVCDRMCPRPRLELSEIEPMAL